MEILAQGLTLGSQALTVAVHLIAMKYALSFSPFGLVKSYSVVHPESTGSMVTELVKETVSKVYNGFTGKKTEVVIESHAADRVTNTMVTLAQSIGSKLPSKDFKESLRKTVEATPVHTAQGSPVQTQETSSINEPDEITVPRNLGEVLEMYANKNDVTHDIQPFQLPSATELQTAMDIINKNAVDPQKEAINKMINKAVGFAVPFVTDYLEQNYPQLKGPFESSLKNWVEYDKSNNETNFSNEEIQDFLKVFNEVFIKTDLLKYIMGIAFCYYLIQKGEQFYFSSRDLSTQPKSNGITEEVKETQKVSAKDLLKKLTKERK